MALCIIQNDQDSKKDLCIQVYFYGISCHERRNMYKGNTHQAEILRERNKDGGRKKKRETSKLTFIGTVNTHIQRRKKKIGELPRCIGAFSPLAGKEVSL